MSGTTIDGVERCAENGIKVVIVGGGVGGLGAALECWRKGCEVIVLEKTDKPSPIGDFFTIPPSGLTNLKYFPSMYKDYHQNVYDCTTDVYTPSGKHVACLEPEWNRPGAVHSAHEVKISFIRLRPDWTRMQLEQLSRIGVPVKFGAKVVDIQEYEDVVVVKTSDGQEYSGDICIVASGVGSSITAFTTKEDLNAQDSGFAVARVAFPRSLIKDGTPAAEVMRNIDTRPEFRTYLARNATLVLFLTPDSVAWALIHVNDGGAEESWGSMTDVQSAMRHMDESNIQWDPAVIDFLRQTPGDVIDWNLRWRDPIEKWTSDQGRLVRLGDAAHPFLPTAGNGAGQALEDAISLAECLRLAGKANARWATKVHNKLRFERSSVLQQSGFVNVDELHRANLDALEDAPEDFDVGFYKIGAWVWAHDAEVYAQENYEDCLAALRTHKEFVNTNLPPGHKYQPWSLESEKKRMMSGIRSGLKENGYWGY